MTTGLVAYTAKVRKQSFASDVLFNDLINGETGIGAADKFFFPDAEVRKVTEIKVEVPYNNKETGVEHWTVQHDGKGSSTYILNSIPMVMAARRGRLPRSHSRASQSSNRACNWRISSLMRCGFRT